MNQSLRNTTLFLIVQAAHCGRAPVITCAALNSLLFLAQRTRESHPGSSFT